MPRKNKEEYNEYMKGYMRTKDRTKKTGAEKDFIQKPSKPVLVNGKPVLDISRAAKLVQDTRELIGENIDNKNAMEDDPLLKVIDRYGKYIPIVLELFKGIAASVKEHNDNKPQQQQSLQAPDGWLNMSPMQRLNYKHTRPEWYAAGESFENGVVTNYTNPQINTSYVDSTYRPPKQNLQSLAHKYPEPPLVIDKPPEETKPESQNSKNSDDTQNQKILMEAKPQEPSSKDILAELQKDNARYIDLGANALNNMTPEDFLKWIDDPELDKKIKVFIPILPVHVRGMILNTSKEDLQQLFKNKCPERYERLVEKGKLEKILQLFEVLKVEVGK